MTTQNIIIQAGATFQRSIALTDPSNNPMNVSGYTANAAIRREWTSNTFTSFEVDLETGSLTLRLEPATTANLTPGFYVYDAKISNGTDAYRVIEGIAEVTPEVTD